MEDAKSVYAERIDRVTNHLLARLDEPPSLDELARVACFSPYHFHRVFTAVTGETVNGFTNRLRLEKAARLLRYSERSATDIALDCGFSSSATFSRAFRQYFGIAPLAYRKGGDIENSKIRKELFPTDAYVIPMGEEELRAAFPVDLQEFPERRVAYIRVIGGYVGTRVQDAFTRMVTWAKERGVFASGTLFGMSLDDPFVTPQDKYRYEVCLTIPEDFAVERDEMTVMTMPRCRYAVTRAMGDLRVVATATSYLFRTWLVTSPFEPEHQHGLEIFRDKERACNGTYFDLDLCVPVKPLQRI